LLNAQKFVITDYKFPHIDTEEKMIRDAGGSVQAFQCVTEAEVIQAASDADAILVQWAPITAAVLEQLKHCKIIVRYGIGVDNIDLEAARRLGITVCNVPRYCIDEVADHTFALALALSRQLGAIDQRLRQGIWNTQPPNPMPASRQMTFATIGYGRIARAVLDRARACKFRLAACVPYLPAGTHLPDDVQLLDMEGALRTSDVISLHSPLNPSTRHMVNAKTFSKMKPTALLVNTARGGLIDTVALAAALRAGEIGGAALDVYEQEPVRKDHPIFSSPNTLLTSHVAWYSELSAPELQKQAVEEAIRVASGQEPTSRVA
jgi:D-3-phosphoglycerate dehydrogenase